MIFDLSMSVNTFISLASAYDMTEFIEECKKVDLPEKINGKDIPASLNHITFGQRIDLTEISTENFLFMPIQALLGLPLKKILRSKICDIIRFSFFVAEELRRLNERDEKYLKYEPEPEEVKAGLKKMDNGLFGTIDLVARRMGITHDAVLELSQQKVFMMLKIDLDNNAYEKRLRKIYAEKQ